MSVTIETSAGGVPTCALRNGGEDWAHQMRRNVFGKPVVENEPGEDFTEDWKFPLAKQSQDGTLLRSPAENLRGTRS